VPARSRSQRPSASAREARNERMRASTARQKAQEQAGEEAAAPVTKQH